MSDDELSGHDEREPGLLDGFFVRLFATGLGLLTRSLDVTTLLIQHPRQPRLLMPYLRVWRAAIVSSPFPPRTFEKVHAARQRGLALRELIYGETPLFTARRVLRAAGVNERSVVVDPLAGRGRALLAARSLGAAAIGYELLHSHVDAVKEPLADAGVMLSQADGAEVDFAGATHVYLAWTCMSERTQRRFLERLRALPAGVVVITLSSPISDASFRPLQRLTGLYTWGVEAVYVQVREGALDERGNGSSPE